MSLLDSFRKNSTIPPKDSVKLAAKKTPVKAKKTGESIVQKDETSATTLPGGELAFRLIRQPHVSEKANELSKRGVYTFEVAPLAEKIAIKKAIESLYKVKVVGIRTLRSEGKPVYRGRRMGRRVAWKKALITLQKGQTLQVYEGA